MRFKHWHGIWEITIQVEKLSGNQQAAILFCDFQEFTAKENQQLDKIYDVDETITWEVSNKDSSLQNNGVHLAIDWGKNE